MLPLRIVTAARHCALRHRRVARLRPLATHADPLICRLISVEKTPEHTLASVPHVRAASSSSSSSSLLSYTTSTLPTPSPSPSSVIVHRPATFDTTPPAGDSSASGNLADDNAGGLSDNRGNSDGANDADDPDDQDHLGDSGIVPSSNDAAGSENTLQLLNRRAPFSPVLALPILRRPLFPGFFKTIIISDPNVIRAVLAAIREKQPYVAAVLLKSEDSDRDTFSSADEVHDVGVFCEIANAVSGPTLAPGSGARSSSKLPASLTVVLYPLKRIKITGLVNANTTTREKKTVVEAPEAAASTNVAETASTASQTATAAAAEEKPAESQRQQQTSPHAFLLPGAQNSRRAGSGYSGIAIVNTETLHDEKYKLSSSLLRALANETVAVLKDIAALNPIFREQVAGFSLSPAAATIFDDPGRLADFAAAVSGGSEPDELQDVLRSTSIEERLQRALVVLKKELVNAQLQSKLSKDIEGKIQKRQREYYLMEQMRAIKKELGIDAGSDGGRERLLEKYRERIAQLGGTEALPAAVGSVIDEEMQKLSHIEPASSEFSVSRNYLDWLTCLPWNKNTSELFDIAKARKILDDDHYGMDDVKERILEFIAVNKLRRGAAQGKIICLSGPPGVGKTSIGRSIARALGRNFFRFSVGGLSDVAEIKGHRRTYVGAMPGKVVQALKKVQSENPLILIDEIDKLSRFGGGGGGGGGGGDPASALLELLDPEQNSAFLDHYLDVPLDLSRVLFVCTANVTEAIPGPLLDRMEVINVSGYVAEEKMAIADRFLLPQAFESCGLANLPVSVSKDALENLIRYYCRESGVRSLKKHVEKITRKLALKTIRTAEAKILDSEAPPSPDAISTSPTAPEIVNDNQDSESSAPAPTEDSTVKICPDGLENMDEIKVTPENLSEFVGKPVYESERLFDCPPAGVVTGLAWTSAGGATLYVESVIDGSKPLRPKSSDDTNTTNSDSATSSTTPAVGSLHQTGQLGDVMKESTSIAHTFAKSFIAREIPELRTLVESSKIHLHVPDGATPKDGPSAGITMTTSIISLMTGKKVPGNIGMTGEITLSGLVLKIGGLKEKIIAAKRSGIDTVVFPKANEADWAELPEFIRQGINPILVETYDQVYRACFRDTAEVK